MKRRVKIKALPKAGSGLQTAIDMRAGLYGGTNGNNQFTRPNLSSYFSQEPIEVNHTLKPVDREDANLEAERGEKVVTDLNKDGIPEHYTVGGKRHSEGGTPLNLPKDSFIFSDTSKMKIKDPNILLDFGMSTKGKGYTPADIAKKFDINNYRKVLADPDTDDLQRKTAESMISNYNLKLAKLSLIQESKKGFPQGIPVIAMPFLEKSQINPSQFIPDQGQAEQPSENDNIAKFGANVIAQLKMRKDGGFYQQGGIPEHDYSKQLSEVDKLRKQVEWNKNYKKAYDDSIRKQQESAKAKKSKEDDLKNREYFDRILDNKIQERIKSMNQFADKPADYRGAKITWGTSNNTLADYQADLLRLMEQQKNNKTEWSKIKSELDPSFKSPVDSNLPVFTPGTNNTTQESSPKLQSKTYRTPTESFDATAFPKSKSVATPTPVKQKDVSQMTNEELEAYLNKK